MVGVVVRVVVRVVVAVAVGFAVVVRVGVGVVNSQNRTPDEYTEILKLYALTLAPIGICYECAGECDTTFHPRCKRPWLESRLRDRHGPVARTAEEIRAAR